MPPILIGAERKLDNEGREDFFEEKKVRSMGEKKVKEDWG